MRIRLAILGLVGLGLSGCYLTHRRTGVDDGDAGPTLGDARADAISGPCTIVGTYRTNGGNIMMLTLAADGTYSADGGRFVGTYAWNGTVLAFSPGPGSTSNECASRSNSTVGVTFDAACRQALVVVMIDNCTGAGLLSQSSNITRQ